MIFLIIILVLCWSFFGMLLYCDIIMYKSLDETLNLLGFLCVGPVGWCLVFCDYIQEKYKINKNIFLKDKKDD